MAKKRIVICADGTWNDPEDEIPTNVLRVARAIKPEDNKGVQQVVFYDWGVGSYYAETRGGISGLGMEKNIQDGYRFIVQNFDPGDEIYMFGYSRGAYTIRALAGMLNKCGILKKSNAALIPDAFDFYKVKKHKPSSAAAGQWRKKHSVGGTGRGEVNYVGVWDTVGALGIPTRSLAFVEERDLFFDPILGSNVKCARHAVAIDEKRGDFKPTLWEEYEAETVKQVWFAGVHGDIGGGAKANKDRQTGQRKHLSDVALSWLVQEADLEGLKFEPFLVGGTQQHHRLKPNRSYKGFYKVLGKHIRGIPTAERVHESVRKRYNSDPDYRPKPLTDWLAANGGQWQVEP